MYPLIGLSTSLQEMSKVLVEKKKAPIDKAEWFKYLGIRLAMSCEPSRGPVPTFWDSSIDPESVYTAKNFGPRFKMTRHRFEDINSAMCFGPMDDVIRAENVRASVLQLYC